MNYLNRNLNLFGFGKKEETQPEEVKDDAGKNTETDKIVEFVEKPQVLVVGDNANTTSLSSGQEEVDVSILPTLTEEDNHEHEKEPIPSVTQRELKYMKRARYADKIAPKFKKSYTIKNNKTGQIVEVRAASSCHACNIVGWKTNQTKVVSETVIEDKVEDKPEVKNV